VNGLASKTADHTRDQAVQLTGAAARPARATVRRPARSTFALRAMLFDVVMLALAVGVVQLASPTVSPTGEVPREPLGWLLLFCVLVPLLFRLRGMYRAPLRLELTETMRLVATGTALAATLAMAARVLSANDPYVAAETVRHLLVAAPLLLLGRAAVLSREAHDRRALLAGRRTLIVGAGRVGQLIAGRLLSDPELGSLPIGFVDADPLELEGLAARLPVYCWADAERLLAQGDVDHVIIAFSTVDHEQLLDLARRCSARRVSVSVVPRLFEVEGERVAMEHLGGLPIVELAPRDPKGWQFQVKYAIDRVVAAALLLLVLPVLLTAAVAVRLSLGRPIFFRQLRVGRDGHAFKMLKFRTLHQVTGADAEADADWAAQELGEMVAGHTPLDSRVSRVGAFLRRTSIDELPQLWNVVCGDMSLVGPRPERAAYVDRFEVRLYRYRDRHRVKSGLTGWAQVHGLRGNTSLRDRVEWDNHYIENWSPWFDLKILLMTVTAVVRQGR
jgi:exopolysaccharide biosynthesis polyprenyl glycosylphosphotransferase